MRSILTRDMALVASSRKCSTCFRRTIPAQSSRRDLACLNALMFAAGTMAGLFRKHVAKPPRRILEICAGDGSFMLAVARRLAKRWPKVEVVLLDRVALVSPERRDGFKNLGWRAEAITAGCFRLAGPQHGRQVRRDLRQSVPASFRRRSARAPLFSAAKGGASLPCGGALQGGVSACSNAPALAAWRKPLTLRDRGSQRPRRFHRDRTLPIFGRRKTGRLWKSGAPACCTSLPGRPGRRRASVNYDAVVVGAGPAGASAGLALARLGGIAIIEKSEFPRRKVCGEFISATNLALLDRLEIGDAWRTEAGPEIRRVGFFAGSTCVEAPIASRRKRRFWPGARA